MSKALLQLHDVCVRYGGVKALENVSISLYEGEIVALMGANGAGKSTILKAIFGLVPIHSGYIAWKGKALRPISHRVARLGIAFVPQGRRVFARMSVEENLEIGGFMLSGRQEIRGRMEEVMRLFPVLQKKRTMLSGKLSGGQQQMLALARGLMACPKVLLLDEPSLGLAPKVVKEVFAKIKEINETQKTSIMVVEHNIKSLLAIADRAYLMDKGKIVVHGTSQELLKNDILSRVVMGKVL